VKSVTLTPDGKSSSIGIVSGLTEATTISAVFFPSDA
jgi:hypothetical protein